MFTVRQFRDSDLEQVLMLHEHAHADVDVHEPKGYFDDLHSIPDFYLQSGGEFLVGEFDDRIVAMVGLKHTSSDRAEITRMRVHPQYQQRGFGSQILRRLEERAVGLQYQTLHSDTLISQTAARDLYRKNGYREIGRGKKSGFDVVFFEKGLEA